MMRKKWISILLFLSITTFCIAQTEGYKFYAAIDSVKTSGFYYIKISPELSAHLKMDYTDLRIINDSGKWIPHVLRFPDDWMTHESITQELKFTITANTKLNSILVIDAGNDTLSNMVLVIKNTAVARSSTLSGSDDQKTWFVIKDDIQLNPETSEANTTINFRIDFPRSSYHYYKLTIYNIKKDPLNIIGIERYTAEVTKSINNKTLNPPPVIEQKDSGKISFIKVIQQQPYHFDNISLKLSGVKNFFRNVELYIPSGSIPSSSNPGRILQSFNISNNSTLQFNIPPNNALVFYLLIYNEDNLPLKVDEVNTLIRNYYITSYLEQGVNYKLIIGNIEATEPRYDIVGALTLKTYDSLPFLSFGKIIPFEEKSIAIVSSKNNQWILWTAIAAVLFILLLVTRKMVKEVDKRKEHDSL
jgi:hypothetical protein